MDFDAVIVGAGPNGLAAAINLQRRGARTLLIEGDATVGGGARTAELTLPGFRHDVCSAIHPTGGASPFFQSLSLEKYGLEFIHPEVLAAHPFDDGAAAALYRSVDPTARRLGKDAKAYSAAIGPVLGRWAALSTDVWGPMRWPKHPWLMTRFGLDALRSAEGFARRFETREARGLWAGMCAHGGIPLSRATSSAIGLVLAVAGHVAGWPLARGGSQSITDALAACYRAHGGTLKTGWRVATLAELPASRAILLDVTPSQALALAGPAFSWLYRQQLRRHRYGPGVFKVDWALYEPVPFIAPATVFFQRMRREPRPEDKAIGSRIPRGDAQRKRISCKARLRRGRCAPGAGGKQRCGGKRHTAGNERPPRHLRYVTRKWVEGAIGAGHGILQTSPTPFRGQGAWHN